MKKQWYIVKKKTSKHWTGYELTADDIPNLKKEYEVKGPYKNLVQCLIAANE